MKLRHIIRNLIVYSRDCYHKSIIRSPRIYLDENYKFEPFKRVNCIKNDQLFLLRPFYLLKWGKGDIIRKLQKLVKKLDF